MENNYEKMKKITGYPHVDKLWMKYYTEEQKEIIIPNNMNIVDYLKEKNKDNSSIVAEEYYLRDITYGELFYRSDLAARALSQIGVSQGNRIMNLISNIPEAGQIWFGATDLGAISDFTDPRPDGMNEEENAKKILEVLKFEKAKYIVALDFSYLSMLRPIENEIKELGIDTIIIASASDSMIEEGTLDYYLDVANYNHLANSRNDREHKMCDRDAVINRLLMDKKVKEEIDEAIKKSPLRIIRYKDLVNECKNSQYTKVSDSDLINYIGHTSGTSGSRPKPITITNKQGIALMEQCEKGNFSPKYKERAFHLLPFFAPAGAYSNYLVNLSTGATTVDVSEFYIGDFGYLIPKHKPNYILATPAWISLLPNYEPLKNEDLSYINKIILVGDAAKGDDIIKIKNWLNKHNSSGEVEVAHGMSELGGCGSYATDVYNKTDSIGIPLPNTIYSLVDPEIKDHLVPIRFGENDEMIEGELIIHAPNMTSGLLGSDVIVPHLEMDGKLWLRTGDIAKMDRDGVFYYSARKDRSFTRVDGYKVKPYEIEPIIESNKSIKYAAITGYFDERKNGNMPVCHIVLNDEFLDVDPVEIVNDIVYNTIIKNPNMSSRQIPSKFKVVDKFKLTKNNKIDYKSLPQEEFDGTEINVDVDETNLNVGSINIYVAGDKEKVLKLK